MDISLEFTKRIMNEHKPSSLRGKTVDRTLQNLHLFSECVHVGGMHMGVFVCVHVLGVCTWMCVCWGMHMGRWVCMCWGYTHVCVCSCVGVCTYW